jgi:glyoxylase-like metal-dependent hydrolase (beta-lactamase superfamily II)
MGPDGRVHPVPAAGRSPRQDHRVHLPGNLARLGLGPADIDMVVVFSHLHADHIGWLATETPSGPRLTFPGAEHHLAEAEWAYWSDPVRVYTGGAGRLRFSSRCSGRG